MLFGCLVDAAREALRNRLEREMKLESYPEPTELEKRILARGFDQREARGEVRRKAEAILTIFAVRGSSVAPELRERVLRCTDLEQLDGWLVRVVEGEDPEQALALH